MQETGIDLYEIYRWDMEKKLVYAQHLREFDKAQEKAAEEDRPDMPDMDDIEGMGGSGGPRGVPSPGNMSSMGGRKPFKGREDVHPSLRQYENLVNVIGEEEDDRRRQEAGKPPLSEVEDDDDDDPAAPAAEQSDGPDDPGPDEIVQVMD